MVVGGVCGEKLRFVATDLHPLYEADCEDDRFAFGELTGLAAEEGCGLAAEEGCSSEQVSTRG